MTGPSPLEAIEALSVPIPEDISGLIKLLIAKQASENCNCSGCQITRKAAAALERMAREIEILKRALGTNVD